MRVPPNDGSHWNGRKEPRLKRLANLGVLATYDDGDRTLVLSGELDLASSCLVGDKLSDLEAGASAGCHTILVRTGYGARHEREAVARIPRLLAVVGSLAGAVDAWLGRGAAAPPGC